jgi:uncharacterized OB-fold protein
MTAVVEARTGRILAWRDGIPLRYEYTAGVAGEEFLRRLKEGRLVASKCTKCGDVRLPPRAYCLECGARTRVDVEVLHTGRIASLSTARLDGRGGSLAGASRRTFGYVTFAGVDGGVLHRILYDGRTPPKVGDPATPRFAPIEKRTGSVLDLEGFRTSALRSRRND